MITSALLLALASSGVQESAATEAESSAPVRERRVCRLEERLGTILPRRVCRSITDWDQIDEAQRKITERDTQHMRNNSRNSMRSEENPSMRPN
jgi:predicted secreted protein